ncbi:MAG: MerR family transcriptional regulator [Alphaproteobacteria bacterium]|nr:MerR family transcriptional regulator [Rickettsiales bacterium]
MVAKVDIEKKFSIGQVANMIGVKEHTIRFWTSEFNHIRYSVGLGKRKYYKLNAIKQLQEIRYLMKERNLNIDNIKKLLPHCSGDKRKLSIFLLQTTPESFAKINSLFNKEQYNHAKLAQQIYKAGSKTVKSKSNNTVNRQQNNRTTVILPVNTPLFTKNTEGNSGKPTKTLVADDIGQFTHATNTNNDLKFFLTEQEIEQVINNLSDIKKCLLESKIIDNNN